MSPPISKILGKGRGNEQELMGIRVAVAVEVHVSITETFLYPAGDVLNIFF